MESDNDRLRPESWSADHPNEGDDERWKGSPSTESTGQEGHNEEVTAEHAREENAPSREAKPPAGARTEPPARAREP